MGQLIQHSISGFRHINFSGLKQAFVTKEAVFFFPYCEFPFFGWWRLCGPIIWTLHF